MHEFHSRIATQLGQLAQLLVGETKESLLLQLFPDELAYWQNLYDNRLSFRKIRLLDRDSGYALYNLTRKR